MVQGSSCLPATRQLCDLEQPFNWLGPNAPVCRRGTWSDQVSDILLQEQHQEMNVRNKVLLLMLPMSVKEAVEKWA